MALVPVNNAIGEIAKDARGEHGAAAARPAIGERAADREDQQHHECDGGERDEEAVHPRAHAEGSTGVVGTDQVENALDDRALVALEEAIDDPPLRGLIECVKRERNGRERDVWRPRARRGRGARWHRLRDV